MKFPRSTLHVAFKYAVKDMELTKALLNDLFEEVGLPHIVSCQELHPEIKASEDGRKNILDLLVRDEKGRDIAVEMQIGYKGYFNNRLLSYWLAIAHQNLRKGPKGPIISESMRPVIVVAVSNFAMGAKANPIHRYDIREYETGELFSDCLSIVLAQVPRFKKTPHLVRSEHAKAWLGFFSNEKRFDALVKGYSMTDTARKSVDEVKSNDEDWSEYLRIREMLDNEEYNQEAIRHEAKAQGLAEGIVEGGVLALLKFGHTPQEIAEAMGLTVEKVNEIAARSSV